jgi:hypothetical protein
MVKARGPLVHGAVILTVILIGDWTGLRSTGERDRPADEDPLRCAAESRCLAAGAFPLEVRSGSELESLKSRGFLLICAHSTISISRLVRDMDGLHLPARARLEAARAIGPVRNGFPYVVSAIPERSLTRCESPTSRGYRVVHPE